MTNQPPLVEQVRKDLEAGHHDLAVTGLTRLLTTYQLPAGTVLSAANLISKIPQSAYPRRPVRVAILASCVVNMLQPFLEARLFPYGLRPEVYFAPFRQELQLALNPESELYRFNPDVVIVFQLGFQVVAGLYNGTVSADGAGVAKTVADALDLQRAMLDAIREQSRAAIIVHTPESPRQFSVGEPPTAKALIRTWIEGLREWCQSRAAVYVLDYDALIHRHGLERWYDVKYWHLAKAPLAHASLDALAREYTRYLIPVCAATRKCLVLDCDGVLWGGIVGEHGMTGIQLGSEYPGSAYREFQTALLELYHRGVLLAINSKNNEGDVLEVLERHPETVLRPDHFVTMKINWESKVGNLIAIAHELNIGLDSIVFVDDRPEERDMVRTMLPEVLVPEVPTDPLWYRFWISDLPVFETLRVSEEDRRRTAMYQADRQRKEMSRTAISLEQYYHNLDVRVRMHQMTEDEAPRVVQLFARTNQFNLTSKRYGYEDVSRLAGSPKHQIFTLAVYDRFGDQGLTGVAVVRIEPTAWVIDSFLLSCRVIGFGVAEALLSWIGARALERNAEQLIGHYVPSPKNRVVSSFYEQHGFKRLSSPEDRPGERWLRSLSEGSIPMPAWVTVDSD
jgi:FkbH-like protein